MPLAFPRIGIFTAYTENSGPEIKRLAGFQMAARTITVAITFLMLSVSCQGQNDCPWLNVATASGVLGGPAVVTVNKTGETTGSCIFRLQTAPNEALTISVMTAPPAQDGMNDFAAYKAKCSSAAVPLKAIGNEAVLCANDTGQTHGKRAIGRVRDSIFIVDLSTNANKDASPTNDPLAEKVVETAEQVAGILF